MHNVASLTTKTAHCMHTVINQQWTSECKLVGGA